MAAPADTAGAVDAADVAAPPADEGTAEDPGPLPDVPLEPDTPAAEDVLPDTAPPPDVGEEDTGPTGPDIQAPPPGELAVNCAVPYVLDAEKMQKQDVPYLMEHFAHLMQDYCMVGTVLGVEVHSYAEKMYFGSHAKGSPALTLQQSSMDKGLLGPDPKYTVQVTFDPLSAFTEGSAWTVGDGATVLMLQHDGLEGLCTAGFGTGGTLTVTQAEGVQEDEGGSFTVEGTMAIEPAEDVPGVCAMVAMMAPCCCTGDCEGKECGDDGCGGSCGTCAEGTTCNKTGKCQ